MGGAASYLRVGAANADLSVEKIFRRCPSTTDGADAGDSIVLVDDNGRIRHVSQSTDEALEPWLDYLMSPPRLAAASRRRRDASDLAALPSCYSLADPFMALPIGVVHYLARRILPGSLADRMLEGVEHVRRAIACRWLPLDVPIAV